MIRVDGITTNGTLEVVLRRRHLNHRPEPPRSCFKVLRDEDKIDYNETTQTMIIVCVKAKVMSTTSMENPFKTVPKTEDWVVR